MAVLELT